MLRLLGGRRSWPEGLDAVLASGLPAVVLSGEPSPDAELMSLSTVPAGVAAEALAYLREGGPANLAQLARFLSDTILLTGEGFEPPEVLPSYGPHPGPHGERARLPEPPGRRHRVLPLPRGRREHRVRGHAGRCRRGGPAATRRPVYCGSLRAAPPEFYDLLRGVDAVIVTVLAAGGTVAADAAAGGGEDAWDVAALAALDVPVLQALCLTTPRETWAASSAALTPMDAAMQVAVPEFDGRLITVPFSFKEAGPDGIGVYAADPERAARVAGIAVAHARLRHIPPTANGWPSCCPPTRPGTPGSATPWGWTPPPRPWSCSGRSARPATTWATRPSPRTGTR